MSNILMRVDGSCYPNPGSMGIGVVIYQDDIIIRKISEYAGYGTNNIAEYMALIRGLEEISPLKVEKIEVYCDSQLVVKQLNGEYKVRDEKILTLFLKIKKICRNIKGEILFIWNSRDNNTIADDLAKKAVIKGEIENRKKEAKELTVCIGKNYYSVENIEKKEINKVNINLSNCDCLDFKSKAKKLKIECKHIIAVKIFLKKNERNGTQIKNDHKMRILILSKMVSRQVWIKTFTELNKKTKLNLEFINCNGDDSANIGKYISKAEVIIGNLKNEEDFQKAKLLKLVQIPFTGVDGINLEIFKKRKNIYLCNVHASKHAVTEHALALMFALSKNIISNDKDLRKGIWHGFSSKEPTIQLYGKKLGIIGLGSIGWEIAKIGHALGMKISAIKREINVADFKKKKISKFLGVKKDLETLIKKSDFIVISIPLTKDTKGMITKK